MNNFCSVYRVTHCSNQGLLLFLHSENTLGRLWGLNRMLGFECVLASCKANSLTALLSLRPIKNILTTMLSTFLATDFKTIKHGMWLKWRKKKSVLIKFRIQCFISKYCQTKQIGKQDKVTSFKRTKLNRETKIKQKNHVQSSHFKYNWNDYK